MKWDFWQIKFPSAFVGILSNCFFCLWTTMNSTVYNMLCKIVFLFMPVACIHVTKGELFILCCVAVVTSVTALLSKQTLKELYSKYRASQSHLGSNHKMFEFQKSQHICLETRSQGTLQQISCFTITTFDSKKNPHIWWQTRSQGGPLKEQQILGFRFSFQRKSKH